MRLLIALSLLIAAPARADAIAEILDQLKARIAKAEKLTDGKPIPQSRAQLKEELRAMRNDVERAQKVLATPTVPPPVTMPPPQAPPPMPPPPQASPRLTLAGVVRLTVRCTQMACGAENRCCNHCGVSARITPDDGPFARREVVVESGHGCTADGCGKVSGCALKDGERGRIADVTVSCGPEGQCTARK